jgi:hypothetical protein
LVWAFSAKNEVPRAPSATEPASRDRSAMHFPKRSFSRSKCKDLGFAGGAPQWHRDHQRRGFGGNSELPPRCKLHYTWSLSLGARLEPARATRPWYAGQSFPAHAAPSLHRHKAAKPAKSSTQRSSARADGWRISGSLLTSCINSVVPRRNAQSGYRSR